MESTIVAVDISNPLADGGGLNPRMAALRRHRVRLDSLSRTSLICTAVTFFTFLGLFALIGSNGPSVSLSSTAGGAPGGSVALFDYNSKCDFGPGGEQISKIPYCWAHDVDFETRFVQSFTLSFTILRKLVNVNQLPQADVPLKLSTDWFGYTPERGFFLIHTGNVSRIIHCYSNQLSCEPTSVIKTVSIPVTKYHIRVYVDPLLVDSLIRAPVLASTAAFNIRVTNPLFAMYELGFKAFFLTISLLALLYYSWMTGCMYCGMTCHLRTYSFLYKVLKKMCSKRSATNETSTYGNEIFDGTSFAKEQSTNWVQALLIALVLFNEPLLWAKYYYPQDGANLSYMSVAGQLTFLAILLAYFLVEFGLLAAYSNFENTVTPFRFYAPKFFWVFIYWSMAMSVYAWIITQQQKDPLFDWAEFVYTTSFVAKSGEGPGGSDAINAQLFFLYWSSILATLYLLYLTWLILRACTSIMKFSFGTRFVFSLHLLVLFSTALGLSAGVIYSTEIDTALNLTYFNALFNAYILTLAWLYSPSAYVDLEAQIVDDNQIQQTQGDTRNKEEEEEEEEEEDKGVENKDMDPEEYDIDDAHGRDKNEGRNREGRKVESKSAFGPGIPYKDEKGLSIIKSSDIEIYAARSEADDIAADNEEEDLGLTLRSQRVRRLSETSRGRSTIENSSGGGQVWQTSTGVATKTNASYDSQLDPKLAAVFNFSSPAMSASSRQQQQQQQQSVLTMSALNLNSETGMTTQNTAGNAIVSSGTATSNLATGTFDFEGSATTTTTTTSSSSSSSSISAAVSVETNSVIDNTLSNTLSQQTLNSSLNSKAGEGTTPAIVTFEDLFGEIATDTSKPVKAVVVPVAPTLAISKSDELFVFDKRIEKEDDSNDKTEHLEGIEHSTGVGDNQMLKSTNGLDLLSHQTTDTAEFSSTSSSKATATVTNPFDDDKDPFASFNDF
jgi:hypothetical protein